VTHPSRSRPAAADHSLTDPRLLPMPALFAAGNPGAISVDVRHCHHGPVGTRLWRLLVESGLLPEPEPGHYHDEYLLDRGLGITDLVKRATRRGTDAKPEELAAGRERVLQIIKRYKPGVVCGVYKRALEVLLGRSLRGEWGLLADEPVGGVKVFALRWAYVEWEVALASVRELRRVAEV